MARRVVPTLIGTILLAVIAAGCGGSSGRSTSTLSAASSSAGTGTASSNGVPVGYAVYHGNGFSFDAPLGLQAQPYNFQGLPSGGSSAVLSPAGVSAADADEQILEIVNPRLQTSLTEVASNLRNAELASHSVKNVQTSVHSVKVSGAQAAQVFSESYVASNPPGVTPHEVLFKRTWLMVVPKPGTLIDLIVAVEPQLGGRMDASTVIGSFRLGS